MPHFSQYFINITLNVGGFGRYCEEILILNFLVHFFTDTREVYVRNHSDVYFPF